MYIHRTIFLCPVLLWKNKYGSDKEKMQAEYRSQTAHSYVN